MHSIFRGPFDQIIPLSPRRSIEGESSHRSIQFCLYLSSRNMWDHQYVFFKTHALGLCASQALRVLWLSAALICLACGVYRNSPNNYFTHWGKHVSTMISYKLWRCCASSKRLRRSTYYSSHSCGYLSKCGAFIGHPTEYKVFLERNGIFVAYRTSVWKFRGGWDTLAFGRR